MMVEEKGLRVLRPDSAIPEAIRERWRTHRRRGLCGCLLDDPALAQSDHKKRCRMRGW